MLSLSIVLTVLSMYFIGVSGLRVLPLSINGWMDDDDDDDDDDVIIIIIIIITFVLPLGTKNNNNKLITTFCLV